MPKDNQNQVIWKPVLIIGLVAALYFAIGRLSLSLVVGPENIAVIWPLSGIFLAAVLLTKKKFRPWLIGVLFLTDFIVEMMAGTSPLISLIYAFSLSFDATLSAWLLLRFAGSPFSFNKSKNVFLYLVFSVLGSNAIGSFIAAAAPALFLSASYWEAWKWWWASDAVGNLLITPLILSWASVKKDDWKNLSLKRSVEMVALFISIFIVNFFAFQVIRDNANLSVILSYIIFPFLIWAGLRFGIRGVASVSVLLAAIVLKNVLLGQHLFQNPETLIDQVFMVQLLIATISLSSLFLASVVTERRFVFNSLQESEKRLTFHDVNSPLANIEWDAHFMVTRWTGAAEDIFGWAENETLGKPLHDLNMVYEEDIPIVEKTMEKLTSGETRQIISSNRNYTKKGEVIYCEWYNSVLLNAEGKMVSVMSRVLDVTSKRKAEEQQKKLTGRINRIASNVPGAIYEYCLKPDGTSFIPYASQGFSKIFGFTPKEVETDASPIFELVHPGDVENFSRSIAESAEKLTPWHHENRIIKRSGETIWIEGKSTPKKLNDGTVLWQGYMANITNRKLAEKALRESEERERQILMDSEKRYRQLFENINVGFVLFEVVQDNEGNPVDLRIIAANKFFEKTTGLVNEKVMGKLLTKALPGIENDEADWIGTYGKIALTGESRQFEQGSELLGYYYTVSAFQSEPKKCAVTFLDITESKLAEKALSESEERLRLSTELGNVAVWEFDFRTNNMTRSNNHDRLYGLEVQEKWEFDTFLNATHPDDRELSNKIIQKSAAPGGPDKYKFDFRVVYPDASVHWLNVTGQVIERNKKGEAVIVRGTLIDITERKHAEEDLRESEQRFLTFMNNTSVFAWMKDEDLKYVFLNKAFEEQYGITLEEVQGKDDFAFRKKHIAEILRTNDQKVLSSGEILITEETVEDRFDQLKHAIVYKFPVMGLFGKRYIGGMSIDITDRKLAEIELIESKSFFEQLFIQSSTSTQLLDKDGWCIRINPKLSELFGVLPEHIEGRKYNILQDGEVISTGVIKHLKKVFEKHETVRWEVNFDIQHASETTGVEVSNPKQKWFSNVAYPILNVNGELTYVIVQHEEITQRKQAELEIKKINKELEKRVEKRTSELTESQEALLNLVDDLNEKSEQLANSSKMLELKNKELETFTYSVSHDLKAPLRGIDGYSQLLEEEYSDILKGDGKKFVKTIREGTKQMNQLIEDLLAYSRLERSTLRPVSIEAKPFIDQLLAFFKNDLHKNNVEVVKDIDDCMIFADSNGLTIALRNIIENAIKFSRNKDRPKIKISLKENISLWLLSVEDNGIGFDMKYHKRIFEIFQRLNLPEQYAGTGIGLAMVYKSVERMNGKIWAESEPGKGAKFYIEILKLNHDG